MHNFNIRYVSSVDKTILIHSIFTWVLTRVLLHEYNCTDGKCHLTITYSIPLDLLHLITVLAIPLIRKVMKHLVCMVNKVHIILLIAFFCQE